MLRFTSASTRLLAAKRPAAKPSAPSLLRHYVYPKEGVFQTNPPSLEPTIPRESARHLPRLPPAYPPQFPLQAPSLPPKTRSILRPRWTTVVSFLLFFSIGYGIVHALELEAPSVPGSQEDAEDLALLFEEFDALSIVQQLRNSWKTVNGLPQRAYEEWTAYEALSDPRRRAERFTTGPLAGSAGVAAQRVFWNEELSVLYLFVNFGAGTGTDLPDGVHHGMLATIFDEAMGRVVVRRTEQRTGITAQLEVEYANTVHPGGWYVIVAGFNQDSESTESKKYMQCIMACCEPDLPNLDGNVLASVHLHATARALFVVPKTVQLQPIPDLF